MARLNKYDRRHQRNLNKYLKLIDEIYKIAAAEAARIGVSLTGFNPDKIFSFDDYPMTKRQIDALLDTYRRNLTAVIVNGVRSSWTLANNKNDELCRQVFGDMIGKLSKAQYRRYFNNNEDALNAFLKRKESGLRLSDRVWNYTNQFKREIELGLDIGIRQGMSADELSRQLRDFLKYPDKLFRRVRDEHGQLQLSKAASEFHPGRGVYRSSYKNARRLAVTETNMAYRSADHERWQQMDFVVGIKIEVSDTNHPIPDICDDLAGKYPKDFKFTGWHPHCRCHVLTILKTMDEMADDAKRIMRGEEPSEHSVNEVTDVPQGFKDWCDDNKDRAKKAYTMPYFIAENPQYVPKGYADLWGSKTPYESYAEYEAAMKYNAQHAGFTPEQKRNNRELSDGLPIIQGKVMNFAEADGSKANPNYTGDPTDTYSNNCQTCTVAYELRRRGFDIEALGETKPSDFARLGMQWNSRWHNPDGTVAKHLFEGCADDTAEARNNFIEDKTKDVGRYEVYCAWRKSGAHFFVVERQKNGALTWFDPQSGRHGGAFEDWLELMKSEHLCVLRVDDKLINPKMVSRFKRSE